ncbi:MAG: hypothetical protein Q9190_006660 [Brigantiaea leucoxantha]
MPETVQANVQWLYDDFPEYNLNEYIIDDYLKTLWGNYKYFVENEREELLKRRIPKE